MHLHPFVCDDSSLPLCHALHRWISPRCCCAHSPFCNYCTGSQRFSQSRCSVIHPSAWIGIEDAGIEDAGIEDAGVEVQLEGMLRMDTFQTKTSAFRVSSQVSSRPRRSIDVHMRCRLDVRATTWRCRWLPLCLLPHRCTPP